MQNQSLGNWEDRALNIGHLSPECVSQKTCLNRFLRDVGEEFILLRKYGPWQQFCCHGFLHCLRESRCGVPQQESCGKK